MLWAYYVLTYIEKEFEKKKADLAVVVAFCGFYLILIEYLTQAYYYGSPMPVLVMQRSFLMSLCYIWSKLNPNAQINLYGMIQVSGAVFPFAMVLMEIVQGGSIRLNLLGILVGHLYVYFKMIMPR